MSDRDTLKAVEAYFASEDGPLYNRWENADIGSFDDRDYDWPEMLASLRDLTVPTDDLGTCGDVPDVAIYRLVWVVLQKPE